MSAYYHETEVNRMMDLRIKEERKKIADWLTNNAFSPDVVGAACLIETGAYAKPHPLETMLEIIQDEG